MSITLPDAYYRFDESSGNAADSTVNANTLTNNNTATFGSGARVNAVTLNGTNQYMSHASNALFQPTTSFSLSFWFNLATLPASGEYAVFSKLGSSSSFSIELGVQPNGIYVISSNDGTATAGHFDEFDSAASILPAISTWHHMAIVYDVSAGSITAYLDNVTKTMTRRAAQNVSSLFAGTDALCIGAISTAARFLNGSIDELGYWKNYKLTAGEVSTLYNGGTPPNYPFFSSSFIPFL